MANLQELMGLVMASTPEQTKWYVAVITPDRGHEKRLRLRARSAAHARIRVPKIARALGYKKFGFTVRPE
jgi:hypothetical protein